MGCSPVHVSFSELQQQALILKDIPMVGASVHSFDEAVEPETLGAWVSKASALCPALWNVNLPLLS